MRYVANGLHCTVKPVLNSHSQKDRKFVFKTNYRLVQVRSIAECSKGSILQYFRPSLSYHLSLRSLFSLFWSDPFTGFTVFPQVRRVLLPVYLDFMEEEDVRMSAYLSFMDTRPPRPDLEIITRSILEEPSYNVGALVWANLMQLSNRTTTCNCIQSL